MKFCVFGKNQLFQCESTFCVFHYTRGRNCVNDNVGDNAVCHIAHSLSGFQALMLFLQAELLAGNAGLKTVLSIRLGLQAVFYNSGTDKQIFAKISVPSNAAVLYDYLRSSLWHFNVIVLGSWI